MNTYVFSYILDGSRDLLTYYCKAPSLSGAVKSFCLFLDNYRDRLIGFEYYYIVRTSNKSYIRRLPSKYCFLLNEYVLEVDYED